jgi:hypothetical protein
MEFHAGIHALRILPEDDQVDVVLIVERVPGISLARTEVYIKVELLAQTDDRAEIGQALALKGRGQLLGGVRFRL